MTSHSVMRTSPLVTARQVITRDRYEHVAVYRDDERVADFQCRVALASASVAGRDAQSALGDSSPGFYVAAAPAQVARDGAIVQGDEVWTRERRYRVVSVDIYAHEAQILMRYIQ